MSEASTHRLAAVWSAGIVRPRATGENVAPDDGAWAELRRHAEVACAGAGGVIFEGSHHLQCVFVSPDAAVRTALQVADTFRESTARRTVGLSLRIGLHVGDVTEAPDGSVGGGALRISARLADVAEPGQLLLSEAAYHLMTRDETVELEDLGERPVPNAGSMHLFALHRSESGPRETLEELLHEELAPLRILSRESEGGMGAIYLARDAGLRRTLVVKVLRSELVTDQEARARFLREAQIIAGLSHPNILGVHAVGELKNGVPYFVMDYIEGGSLKDRIESEGPLSMAEARRILGEVASALAAAHARGVVHRDIKASNVLYDVEAGRALVSDWGIAALDPSMDLSPDTRLTKTGVVIGSPQYMSPEQLAGDEVGPESDVYSLGLLAFELLTGQGPFGQQTPRALMVAHLREDPPDLSDVREDAHPELASLVARCLSKDPSDRPRAERIARHLAPGADSRLEWPPPGLDRLVGMGRRVGMWGLTGVGLVHLPIVLALLPVSVPRPAAYEITEGALLEIIPLVVLLAGVAVVLYSLVQAVRAAVLWRRGLELGYGWITLAEVAADPRGDTGALSTGGREYLTLTPSARYHLRLLRLAATAVPFAAIAAIVVLQPWSALLGGDGGNSPSMLVVSYLVAFALVLCGGVAEYIELGAVRSMRRQLRRRRSPSRSMRRLVGPWYASLEESVDGPPLGRGPTGRWWLGWIGMLGVIALLTTGALVAFPVALMTRLAPIVVAERIPRFSPAQDRPGVLQVGGPFLLESDPSLDPRRAAALLDSLVRQVDEDVGDSVWLNRSTAVVIAGSPLVSGGPYSPCRTGDEQCDSDIVHPDSAFIAADRGLSEAELGYLKGLGHHPGFPVFSRLARASGFNELHMVERRLGAPLADEIETWWELPIPRLSLTRHIAYLKVGYAAAQYSEGDIAGAEETLRELISFGHLLVDDGTTLVAALVGSVVGDLGIDNLRRLFVLTGQLDRAAALQTETGSEAERALDPSPQAGPSLLQTIRQPETMRQLKLEMVPWLLYQESCLSPRRILFGPPPQIIDLLEGPIREEIVRYPEEAFIYDLIMNWESTMAEQPPEAPSIEARTMLRLAWRSARLVGNDRLASCLAYGGL